MQQQAADVHRAHLGSRGIFFITQEEKAEYGRDTRQIRETQNFPTFPILKVLIC